MAKILALVTEAFGGGGGIAQYNRDLLTVLAGLDEVESILVLPRYGTTDLMSPVMRQLPPQAGKLAYALTALIRAYRQNPSVIFCGHLYMLPLAILIGILTGKPVWLQIHGIDAWRRPAALFDWLVRRVDLVTSVSRYTRRCFLTWARLPPERVRVLPNTISNRFQPADRQALRQAWGVDGRRVLLTVGRLAASEAYKGHERVLRCLASLRQRSADIVYLIAGSGDDQLRLQQTAEQLGVAQYTRFLGLMSDEKLAELYALADLFVMPSTGEGFGIVYLEAMACGTPALGLDGDGSCDPLRDGALGYVASQESLCSTIGDALEVSRPSDLCQQVRHWFGVDAFSYQVAALVRRQLSWQSVGAP